MKLTIFGAGGRTGLQLAEQALAAGHDVVALIRNPAKLTLRHERLRIEQGELTDEAAASPPQAALGNPAVDNAVLIEGEVMPTIAIMGAGPGMGLAIAQTFGKEGHQVALLSRTPAKLDPVVAELTDQGIEAAAFAADVLDRPSIVSGLAEVKQRFGQIDVFEYSPNNPALPLASSTELTHDNVQIQLDFNVHGAVAAVNQVLPEMLARGSGTIIFTTGASSVRPELGHDMFGNVAPAAAWLRNWAHGLHAAAAPRGVQVGHIAIGAWIGRQPGATAPEEIAPLYWELHTRHDQVEKVFFPSDQPRILSTS